MPAIRTVEQTLERHAKRIAVRLEKEKGIPKDVTRDRLRGAPGWREREIEYLSGKTDTPREEVAKIVDEGGQRGDTEAERLASGLAEARASLVSEQRRQAKKAAAAPPPPKPGPEYPEGAVVLKDKSYITRGQADSLKTQSPELFKVLDTTKDYAAYTEAVRKANVDISAQRFVIQQDIKRSTKLPGGQYISKVNLAKIKKADPLLHKVLTTKGVDSADNYVSILNKKHESFVKNNTQLPGDQWIDNKQLAGLKESSPTAANILLEDGFDGYKKALNDAATTLEPYLSKQYPPTGEYELQRAMLRNKPKVKEAAELLFPPATIESVYKKYPHLRPGYEYKREAPKIDIVPTETKTAFGLKVSPALATTLASAGIIATAEPTPIGELILLAAVGSIAAYTAYKELQGQKVLPAVKKVATEFEEANNRPIKPSDIRSTELVAPSVLATQILGEAIVYKPGVTEKIISPQVYVAKILGTEEQESLRVKPGAVKPIAIPSVYVAKTLSGEEQEAIKYKPGEIKQVTTPSVLTSSMTAVAEAEKELNTFIRPLMPTFEVGKYLPAIPSKTSTALVALDNAVNEAVQTGEISPEVARQYHRARDRYLTRMKVLNSALSTYIGVNLPKLNTIPSEGITALAATYQQVFQKAQNDGKTDTQAKSLAQSATQTQLRNLAAEQIIAQTKAAQAIKTATKTTTKTATKTATKAATKTATKAATKTATATATKAATTEAVSELAQVAEATTAPPPPPPFKGKKGKEKFEELTAKEKKGSIAWKQGIGWWVVLKDNRSFFVVEKPKGAKVVTRSNRPGKTLQAIKGRVPHITTADLGHQDIKITFAGGGRRGKAEFFADPKRQTKQQIQLGKPGILKPQGRPVKQGNGLKSVKKGRLFHTKTRGGTLLSRRRL